MVYAVAAPLPDFLSSFRRGRVYTPHSWRRE